MQGITQSYYELGGELSSDKRVIRTGSGRNVVKLEKTWLDNVKDGGPQRVECEFIDDTVDGIEVKEPGSTMGNNVPGMERVRNGGWKFQSPLTLIDSTASGSTDYVKQDWGEPAARHAGNQNLREWHNEATQAALQARYQNLVSVALRRFEQPTR